MIRIRINESIQHVLIPKVGHMLRIVRRAPDGEVIDLEYRHPTRRFDGPGGIMFKPHPSRPFITTGCRD